MNAPRRPAWIDHPTGAARLQAEAARCADLMAAATPPAGMAAAPAAPARGPLQLRENWIVEKGGTRRRDGVHLRDMIQPEIMVAQARARHRSRHGDKADDAFVAPFTPGQIAVARAYRDLVEWREGSGIKCASIEARTGGSGGGSGLFIDTFLSQGEWLARLRERVGDWAILDIRRHMDRGNARRPVRAMPALDAFVIEGLDLSAILRSHRWPVAGKTRKALCQGIGDALDLMAGYGPKGASKKGA